MNITLCDRIKHNRCIFDAKKCRELKDPQYSTDIAIVVDFFPINSVEISRYVPQKCIPSRDSPKLSICIFSRLFLAHFLDLHILLRIFLSLEKSRYLFPFNVCNKLTNDMYLLPEKSIFFLLTILK